MCLAWHTYVRPDRYSFWRLLNERVFSFIVLILRQQEQCLRVQIMNNNINLTFGIHHCFITYLTQEWLVKPFTINK